jgi:nitrogenase molybdenum-iron protein alpha/beta subunit
MGLFLALTIGFRPQRRLGAMVAHRSCKAGVTGSTHTHFVSRIASQSRVGYRFYQLPGYRGFLWIAQEILELVAAGSRSVI